MSSFLLFLEIEVIDIPDEEGSPKQENNDNKIEEVQDMMTNDNDDAQKDFTNEMTSETKPECDHAKPSEEDNKKEKAPMPWPPIKPLKISLAKLSMATVEELRRVRPIFRPLPSRRPSTQNTTRTNSKERWVVAPPTPSRGRPKIRQRTLSDSSSSSGSSSRSSSSSSGSSSDSSSGSSRSSSRSSSSSSDSSRSRSRSRSKSNSRSRSRSSVRSEAAKSLLEDDGESLRLALADSASEANTHLSRRNSEVENSDSDNDEKNQEQLPPEPEVPLVDEDDEVFVSPSPIVFNPITPTPRTPAAASDLDLNSSSSPSTVLNTPVHFSQTITPTVCTDTGVCPPGKCNSHLHQTKNNHQTPSAAVSKLNTDDNELTTSLPPPPSLMKIRPNNMNDIMLTPSPEADAHGMATPNYPTSFDPSYTPSSTSPRGDFAAPGGLLYHTPPPSVSFSTATATPEHPASSPRTPIMNPADIEMLPADPIQPPAGFMDKADEVANIAEVVEIADEPFSSFHEETPLDAITPSLNIDKGLEITGIKCNSSSYQLSIRERPERKQWQDRDGWGWTTAAHHGHPGNNVSLNNLQSAGPLPSRSPYSNRGAGGLYQNNQMDFVNKQHPRTPNYPASSTPKRRQFLENLFGPDVLDKTH